MLKKKISIQDLQRFATTREEAELVDRIDLWWDIISNSIIEAARKSIPKKKIANSAATKNKRTKEVHLGKTLTQLGRWIVIGRKNIQLGLTDDYIDLLNDEIRYINSQHRTYIDLAQNWTQELVDDLKGWWRILQARRASELEIKKRKEIENSIKKGAK